MNGERAGLRILGIVGSLRSGSYNRSLLDVAQRLLPESITFETFDLRDVPPYDFDLERHGDPATVIALKRAIASADALLIATPEYQHGIPGVLKNALDWASRPAEQSVLKRKTAAIMGASPGVTGTARAQEQLRQTLAFSEVYVVPSPEVLVAEVHKKVDAAGRFDDAGAEPFIRKLLQNLTCLTIALQDKGPVEATGAIMAVGLGSSAETRHYPH